MNIIKKIGGALAFPWKHNKVFSIVTCIVLALVIAVSIVATQVSLISNTFNTVFGEERRVLVSGDPSQAQYYTPDEGIESKADALAYANAVNEELCEEGFVLLKNDDSLPLARGAKVSVFGMNSVDMVYGGSGSSARDSADSIDLYKSLENADIDYNPDLKSFYEEKQSSGLGRGVSPAMGDPQQRKIMMIMPVVFTVMFINFPAGLVLYWLCNNILSIIQQSWTLRNTK